jgi:alpha-2-macroglobulin-like protein
MRLHRLVLIASALALTGAGKPAHTDPATEQRLGGSNRPATWVTTDKPIYKAGEIVLVRGLMLEAIGHQPLLHRFRVILEVKGPKGETVSSGQTILQDGTFGWTWKVPEGAAGGEYQLVARNPQYGAAPAVRKFDVRVYRAPRLKTQIVFARDGYGPGDTVSATLEAVRAEGGAPVGAKVTAVARVDEVEVARVPATLDRKGRCAVSLALPRLIERGEGSLSFTIDDSGVVETAAKTLPILMQSVDVALYPEGGDLVAGLPGRVYFEGRTPSKKPADIAGVVEDTDGKQAATFRSEHEGRGRFSFTPAKGIAYRLRITEPSGISKTVPLPAALDDGATIEALQDVVGPGQPVRVKLAFTGDRIVKVRLSRREKELDLKTVDAGKQKGSEVQLKAGTADGVLTVLVTDKDGTPLAERLVFRQPAKQLSVTITPDKKRYAPGAQVKLKVKTTLDGEPVAATVALTVTDDSVLELVEKREQAPNLLPMVFLEGEVKELADAHLYFDPKNPKAKPAVDRLLGTQGWRRFALVNVGEFLSNGGDDAQRALAYSQRQWPARLERPKPVMTPVRNTGLIGTRGSGTGTGMGGMAVEGAGGKGGGKGALAPGRPADMDMGMPVGGAPEPVAAPREELAEKKKSAAAERNEVRPAPPPANPAPQPVAAAAAPPASQVAQAPRAPAPAVAAEAQAAPAIAPAAKRDVAKQEVADEKVAMKRVAAKPAWDPVMGGGELRGRQQNRVMVMREYAHQVRPGRQSDDRLDFAETLFWNAGVRTDDKTGEVTVTFGTSDSVTAFKVSAGGFTDSGVLGEASVKLDSVRPFYVEPKLPLEVTQGDLVRLPVAYVNGTDFKLTGTQLVLETKAELALAAAKPMDLGADARARQIIELTVGQKARDAELRLTATAAGFRDVVTRPLAIKPLGFPSQVSASGQLKPDGSVSHSVTIPADLVVGSLATEIAVYPSPAGNLTQALQSMIREPSGCFEQTSSTTYPMTMALQYFQSHSGADPAMVADAQQKLERGYQRLVGYECKQKGYEWFGQDPGHEALTAFGLLHFSDMARVRAVDGQMVATTRAWLLKQRDGKGGFERKRRALHTWVEDREVSDAYITWALLESGEKELSAEVARAREIAGGSVNSNAVALAANVLLLAGDTSLATAAMQKLAAKQDAKTGAVAGSTGSIVGSSGSALEIETTALATLAWLKAPAFAGNVEQAMRYLHASSKGGRYGSTQSTVLALRAIVAYDKTRAAATKGGSVTLWVDGKRTGSPMPYDASTQGALMLTDVAELLTPGSHTVELKQEGGSAIPYSVSVRFHRTAPDSSSETKVALEVSLSKGKLAEGDVVEATARVTNSTDAALPTVVAIVGLPGGLEPRHDQLKELVKKGTIDAYEVLGRDVVLYWKGMTPKQQVRVPLSLLAAVPGRYTGPASRAYLYYGDEHKVWVAGLGADIAARN